MIANCSRCSGVQSAFAPRSSAYTCPVRVGSTAQIAGRSIPGRVFSTNFAVPMSAPVFPALTQACARPSFTRSIATRMEECFLVRIAVRTSSSMPTTSVAGTTLMRAAPCA